MRSLFAWAWALAWAFPLAAVTGALALGDEEVSGLMTSQGKGGRGLTFLSIGDWGDAQAKEYTASLMGEYASKYGASFVLSAGDNMYSVGVKDASDPQLKEKFEDTFSDDSLMIPWFMSGGNHDYYGNITAQIEYSKKSKRWVYPDYYYSQELPLGESGETILILSIDTWRLNGGDTFVSYDARSGRMGLHEQSVELLENAVRTGKLPKDSYHQVMNRFSHHDPADPIERHPDLAQYDWIDRTLMGSNAKWKIVVGHFPVFSCTVFEHGETSSLVEHLRPILERNKVDMYISGHDHILQHIQRGNVQYFGNGSGARVHSRINENYKGLQGYSIGRYGFMVHSVREEEIVTTFIVNNNGKPLEVYQAKQESNK